MDCKFIIGWVNVVDGGYCVYKNFVGSKGSDECDVDFLVIV